MVGGSTARSRFITLLLSSFAVLAFTLATLGIFGVVAYLMAQQTRETLTAQGLYAEARAVPVPERELLDFAGAVATSDTHLIDLKEIVVDLAGEIIREKLGGEPLNLGEGDQEN